MSATHFEILAEEPSMEAFLIQVLPRLLSNDVTFNIHAYNGKPDLLRKLRARLRGYAKWLPENTRVLVVVDRDDANCLLLKQQLEQDAKAANLTTRSAAAGGKWQVVNRIAVEELEAWFFGDWRAVRKAYPKLPANLPTQSAFRLCDAIAGGTWEALERILMKRGYFSDGLRKGEAARAIGQHFDHVTCVSPSFIALRDAVLEATRPS